MVFPLTMSSEFWQEVSLRQTSQRQAFCDAWKALKSVFRPGLRPGPRWGSSRRSPKSPSRLGRGTNTRTSTQRVLFFIVNVKSYRIIVVTRRLMLMTVKVRCVRVRMTRTFSTSECTKTRRYTPSPHPTPLGAFGASILAPSALGLGAFGASVLTRPNSAPVCNTCFKVLGTPMAAGAYSAPQTA